LVLKTSTHAVQKNLVQWLKLLFLRLAKNHNSDDAKIFSQSKWNDVLESFLLSIRIGVPPQSTKADMNQLTYIGRRLLELSGGIVDRGQHDFNASYTVGQNADLCAMLFDISERNEFRNCHAEELCNSLSSSQLFSGIEVSSKDIENWTKDLRDSLSLGFPDKYLVRCTADWTCSC
jgi:hypothetical protein